MTAFGTRTAAFIDRLHGIGRGFALLPHRRRAPDASDLYEVERLLEGLDLLRDLQREEERRAIARTSSRRRDELGDQSPSTKPRRQVG